MEISDALEFIRERHHGVLTTIRRDGRPQLSNIAYFLGDDDVIRISVTDSRAKTANMRRDHRVVLHISDRAEWSYLSFDGTVELSPVASSPDDATCDALVAYYEKVAGKPHPNWDEYRQAMVDEGRLLVTFTPASVVGQIR